jgi:hypothetical protein
MRNSPLKWGVSLCSRPGKSCARVKSRAPPGQRQGYPTVLEPDFSAQSGRSCKRRQSQARIERPRKVRHSAGYPPVGPANWPGRQYTDLFPCPQAPRQRRRIDRRNASPYTDHPRWAWILRQRASSHSASKVRASVGWPSGISEISKLSGSCRPLGGRKKR